MKSGYPRETGRKVRKADDMMDGWVDKIMMMRSKRGK
jgi:hypothetical protein